MVRCIDLGQYNKAHIQNYLYPPRQTSEWISQPTQPTPKSAPYPDGGRLILQKALIHLYEEAQDRSPRLAKTYLTLSELLTRSQGSDIPITVPGVSPGPADLKVNQRSSSYHRYWNYLNPPPSPSPSPGT